MPNKKQTKPTICTGKIPAERRSKSRNCFLHYVKHANLSPKLKRCSEWPRATDKTPHRTSVNLDESIARRHDNPCTTWRCLNRLCSGYTCIKEQRKKWKYCDGDTTCECGLATDNTTHMPQCALLARPCTLDYLSKFNDTAKYCV